jgi:RHS repeat-associated protein
MGGLMDYRARFFSPTLGRFLQPDSIVPDDSNPQDLNRYSYVLNRPILFNDPSGHCPTCLIGAAVGAIAGAAIYASTTWGSGRAWNNNDYLAAVAVGALGGLLIGTGVGALSGVAAFTAIGAGAGAIGGQAGYSLTSKKDYDSGEMIISAGISAAAGAVTGAISGAAGLTVVGASSQIVASTTTKVMITNAIVNGSASVAQYELTAKYRHFDPTWEGRGAAFGSGAASSLLLDGIAGGSVVSPSVKRMAVADKPHFNMWVNGRAFGLTRLLMQDAASQVVRSSSTDLLSRRLERRLPR